MQTCKRCNSLEHGRCEHCKELMNKWYQENKEAKIAYTITNLQINNYSYEKTPKQRLLRNIKRKTRHDFPLTNQNCKFCGEQATEHHHNTTPIEFDKFNFTCHNCHQEQNALKSCKEVLIK